MEIRKLTIDDVAKVTEFFYEEFVPDEPVFSSLKIFEGNSFFSKMNKHEMEKDIIIRPIKSGHSFGAFDQEGNLLGIKLGHILTKETIVKIPSVDWMIRLPEWCVPKAMLRSAYLVKGLEAMQYTQELAFEQCKDNNNKIYENYILGVAKSGRGKGLGDKLLKHSIEHAKEMGCSHCHACTSGIFSQKIFKNNGFDVVFEMNYEDFKDKHGKQIIEHPVHKTSQINVLKLV